MDESKTHAHASQDLRSITIQRYTQLDKEIHDYVQPAMYRRNFSFDLSRDIYDKVHTRVLARVFTQFLWI